jgi:antitoxin (DNA-binding transcriptional repressor) of toxin-antitoxin stability system
MVYFIGQMKGVTMLSNTIGFSEAKSRLSEITEEVNRTGRTVIVYKYNRPWVNISPAVDATPKEVRSSAFGALHHYADPAKRAQEEGALEEAMAQKHAVR